MKDAIVCVYFRDRRKRAATLRGEICKKIVCVGVRGLDVSFWSFLVSSGYFLREKTSSLNVNKCVSRVLSSIFAAPASEVSVKSSRVQNPAKQ